MKKKYLQFLYIFSYSDSRDSFITHLSLCFIDPALLKSK